MTMLARQHLHGHARLPLDLRRVRLLVAIQAGAQTHPARATAGQPHDQQSIGMAGECFAVTRHLVLCAGGDYVIHTGNGGVKVQLAAIASSVFVGMGHPEAQVAKGQVCAVVVFAPFDLFGEQVAGGNIACQQQPAHLGHNLGAIGVVVFRRRFARPEGAVAQKNAFDACAAIDHCPQTPVA